MRQLYIKGHIESVRLHKDSVGNVFTQLLLPDGADGDAVVAALAKSAVIYDTGDPATEWKDVPLKYKRYDGLAPGHDYFGHDITLKPPTDLQAEHAAAIEEL